MNSKLLLIAGSAAIISSSCGSNEAPKEVVVTDTVVKTETITVTAPVDSAAIVAYYEAAHAKAKGTHQESHATHAKSKKQVRIDSHQPIEHHDVTIVVPAASGTAAPTTEAAPATTEVVVIHDTELIYFRPDTKASFPGGEKAFDQYLIKNMQYPDDAAEYGKSGTVHAIVYLDETGKVSKVDFAGKELGLGLEMEARRLLMNSPRWNPATHEGKPVKSKFGIPITFEYKG